MLVKPRPYACKECGRKTYEWYEKCLDCKAENSIVKMSSSCVCHINPDKCDWCKLQKIKEDYRKMKNSISYEDLHWLIKQVEKVKRYEKALFNTYVDGMTIEEILEESDKWGKLKEK